MRSLPQSLPYWSTSWAPHWLTGITGTPRPSAMPGHAGAAALGPAVGGQPDPALGIGDDVPAGHQGDLGDADGVPGELGAALDADGAGPSSSGPATGAEMMPPVAMMRGDDADPVQGDGDDERVEVADVVGGEQQRPVRSSSGTPPVTSTRPKTLTSQEKLRSMDRQNHHGGAAAMASSRANHSGSSGLTSRARSSGRRRGAGARPETSPRLTGGPTGRASPAARAASPGGRS